MTATAERKRIERQFHDEQAVQRRQSFDRGIAHLRFADADYLDHETWVRPAFSLLGPLAGKSVLDFGCGHGMASVVMARQGADVVGFDLSPGYVAEAERRAEANQVSARFVVADGEELPFADRSFDRVWGHAILHHLDMARAGTELRRVLKPGGLAVFCEPWGGNPLLAFARKHLPYPGKERTPDEEPLLPEQLDRLRQQFPRLDWQPHQLLGMVSRAVKSPALAKAMAPADRALFQAVPILRKWCRYVVIRLPLD